MGGKLRVSVTGRGRPLGSVEAGLDIDLDLVVVLIISAYFIVIIKLRICRHFNGFSVKCTDVLCGKISRCLYKIYFKVGFPDSYSTV